MKKLPWFMLLLLLLSSTSCAVKIYLVDRQTVLEDEAAGEWPEFEKEILRKSEASSPTPFATTAENSSKARLFNVLNGELASSPSPRAQAPATSAVKSPAPAGK